MTSIAEPQPDNNASVDVWVTWFWSAFLPAWLEQARDNKGIGYFDLLDENAQPTQNNRRTVLAQARLLFTFSHLALLSNNPLFVEAASVTREALPLFQKVSGGYARARDRKGQVTAEADDNLAYSYDQSFVILGLVTWARLNPNDNIDDELDACWSAIENTLTDPVTGLLLEHDGLNDPALANAPNRAQNPHMHLYEAALQAFEMNTHANWLERAQNIRAIGLDYFLDRSTNTITEFLTPDLSTLAGREGQRREVGHQCEWAWLLHREVELGGDSTVSVIADQLLEFADQHGFATTGVMQGAAFDAVSNDAQWHEKQFLLWPQTEAIKTFAIRKEQAEHAQTARSLTLLVFEKYFANRAAFANQLDNNGEPLWTDALSRLLYHLVLALTEGARAGLWPKPN